MHVLLLNRMQFVPERKPARDDQSNENADQKEPAISRQRDQQNRYDNDRDDETRRSLQAESRPTARFRLHDLILAPPCRDGACPVSRNPSAGNLAAASLPASANSLLSFHLPAIVLYIRKYNNTCKVFHVEHYGTFRGVAPLLLPSRRNLRGGRGRDGSHSLGFRWHLRQRAFQRDG